MYAQIFSSAREKLKNSPMRQKNSIRALLLRLISMWESARGCEMKHAFLRVAPFLFVVVTEGAREEAVAEASAGILGGVGEAGRGRSWARSWREWTLRPS
jgi:hypothetical protein